MGKYWIRISFAITAVLAYIAFAILANRYIDYTVYWANNLGNYETYYLKKDLGRYREYMGDNSLAIMFHPDMGQYKYIDSGDINIGNSLLAGEGGFTPESINQALVESRDRSIGDYVEYLGKKYRIVGYVNANSSVEWIDSIVLKGENPYPIDEYVSIKLINPVKVDEGLERDESIVVEPYIAKIVRYLIALMILGYLSLMLIKILNQRMESDGDVE